MDHKEYKQLYQQLLSSQGREEIGDDPLRVQKLEKKIDNFLEQYPSVIPPDKRPNALFTQISLKELLSRMIQTMIDILNDISELVTQKEQLTQTDFRRKVFRTFTDPSRRFYVGMWLVLLSFVLYFVDSTA
jgi:hypothetical protein